MQIVVAESIDEFARADWDRLFPGEIEDWAYYRAIERSALPGFRFFYFGVVDRGALRAAAPAFLTDYRLDTTLTGVLRRCADALTRVFPRLLTQRLLSLGSPVGEVCHLGFAPDSADAERQRLLGMLLDALREQARRCRAALIATKDTPAHQDALWADAAAAHGLRRQPSLPTASLDVHFRSLDEYLACLGRATRKDLRRKHKAAAGLRIEWRNNIDDIAGEIMRLYRATLANAQFSFEELTPQFFARMLGDLDGRARCVAYWRGERLVAFNLVLHDGTTLLDKFLGMDYAVARELNLYYVTWLENVRYCIENGLTHYLAGQGLHREKRRLGCRLSPNWIWYRHRNPLLDRVFAAFERWFRIDREDEELAALTRPAPPRARQYAAWTAFLGCAALSQIAFKYATFDSGPFAASLHWLGLAVASPWLWVSVASHIGEFVLWMTILSRSALSSAFATSAVLFVVIILASWLLFAEPLTWNRVAGSGVILLGILLLGEDGEPGTEPASPRPAH